MHQDCPLRHLVGAGALCASLLLVACGGGDASAFPSPTDAVTSTASPLLDDEGGVMPADPRAGTSAAVPGSSAQRYATAAHARELLRSLGDGVRWIEIGCCGDAAVEQAI